MLFNYGYICSLFVRLRETSPYRILPYLHLEVVVKTGCKPFYKSSND